MAFTHPTSRQAEPLAAITKARPTLQPAHSKLILPYLPFASLPPNPTRSWWVSRIRVVPSYLEQWLLSCTYLISRVSTSLSDCAASFCRLSGVLSAQVIIYLKLYPKDVTSLKVLVSNGCSQLMRLCVDGALLSGFGYVVSHRIYAYRLAKSPSDVLSSGRWTRLIQLLPVRRSGTTL
jgi:hypothetical protein